MSGREFYSDALGIEIPPSAVYRPRLIQDGDAWIAIYGEDLAIGVVGTGETPAEAMLDFDRAWTASIAKETTE